ncbi:MAG TPA: rhodanese-like domain-containing protein [Acidimicrobiales bacterium]|jgi:rhodanese-related sulfurtransferase|nr:rhodanese-like domain-containing protein [Acidimicrobiales bacterium]
MPRAIARHELRRLLDEAAQVVEVLPKPEYEWAHIADAVNIPLKELDEASAARLERGRPVVVYCNDLQ